MHRHLGKGKFAVAALVLWAAGLSGCSCQPTGATPTSSGAVLYAACSTCHGKAGEGNASIQAPPIAGLPKWYVLEQLHKFRTGRRGAHPDDYEGLRMRPMSRQMATEAEVDTVASYVAGLPVKKAAPTMTEGDATAGKTAYAVCLACHMPNGLGNEQQKAPPLAGQADWYLASQLRKFKAGIRGAAEGDTTGALMRPMAATLVDEAAIRNVVAYINTLPR